jgi:CheY-like chemotaxis protein
MPETPPIRVLIVEDDQSTREGYSKYLALRGYDVLAAATGHEGLMLALGWTPHVVVLDLGLPDIDGWEVSRRLKSADRTTDVPIIALTGATLTHERISAMRAGCDRHLAKPCTAIDLIDAIERCVTR